jgi:uncharacterized protein (TIGR02569 family)
MNPEAIKKFAGTTTAHVLPGGQNESVRAGNLVLKPVRESEKYLWLSECLNEIDFADLQVAVPIRSRDGNYIENSIGATRYYEATFLRDRLEIKLSTCGRLNMMISNVPKPDDFNSWENPWTKAQNLAWSQSGILRMEIPEDIKALMDMRTQFEMPHQLVHVDLAGNILFDNYDNPVVIDFTPGFYPKEYAEVLLLIDSIAWYEGSIENLNLLKLEQELKKQLILRALIFRLSVPLFSEPPKDRRNYQTNFDGYREIIEKVKDASWSPS